MFSFFGGFFVGMVLAFLLAAGTFYHLSSRGLVVTLEIEELAQYLGNQIEARAARELPRVLEEVRPRYRPW